MKKTLAFVFAVLMCFTLLAGCGSSATTPADTPVEPSSESPADAPVNTAAEEIRERSIQIGHIDAATEYDHADVICRLFADKVAELSEGKISIEIVSAAGLGNETEMVEGMGLGTVDAGIVGNSVLSNYVPDLKVFDLPYLVTSRDEAAALFWNKDVMAYFDEQIYDVIGIKVLARGECGFRHLLNNKHPVYTRSDLSGIKIRTMEGEIPVAIWNYLGANATPMAWSETYTAYVQGTVDAVELPFSSVVANGFDQITKYMSLTNHQYSLNIIAFSAQYWESLNAAEQTLLQEAADYAAQAQVEVMKEAEAMFIDTIEANGCQVNEITEFGEFIEAVQPLYTDVAASLGDVYGEIMTVLGR